MSSAPQMASVSHSGIYTGWVSHQRLEPRFHGFKYQLFMLYLALEELPHLFKKNQYE